MWPTPEQAFNCIPSQVPGNLASFLKQASLDTAMAALQQREATPPTPHARQLPSGAGAIWPFGAGVVPSFGGGRPGAAPPPAQLDSPPQRLGTLTLQSPLLRSALTHPSHPMPQLLCSRFCMVTTLCSSGYLFSLKGSLIRMYSCVDQFWTSWLEWARTDHLPLYLWLCKALDQSWKSWLEWARTDHLPLCLWLCDALQARVVVTQGCSENPIIPTQFEFEIGCAGPSWAAWPRRCQRSSGCRCRSRSLATTVRPVLRRWAMLRWPTACTPAWRASCSPAQVQRHSLR